jgi:hypothetical protein
VRPVAAAVLTRRPDRRAGLVGARVVGLTEFSWGPGPVPPGVEDKPPSEGGDYRGMCPPVELTGSTELRGQGRETRWKRGDPPRGYPGERIG